MHAPSIWGILVVAVVVILLFGRGKISGMMGEVAQGIKAFQKGMKDEDKPAERIDTATAAKPQTVDAAEVDRSKDA
ncbi:MULTISPECIES: twin-arginine translocase TatA/TatE family subunit [unclassified Devosia]|jgi:sec-independent protein translocase protein TatA|uniref:twin-arginine translocase TatA/TatE family subunit n=1 Tax=unclassified Devosia TaxID=196773 RepID=UPI00145E1235|nr:MULTISPECIES: twin-arginine translocase TatA/TatE family subunit [unclassified Devosia]MBJ6986999.1 twin-arginine translocase TatA/TatE family subunit [Devosia sp. MC521]MBJ7576627.1 twin-arginine translocase TatA/TatE family subunit [Devosia sp. MC532]MBK1795770.1 twin-arginine translocase TatA/TatE family subunit [Devosia sp. WQ 349K1]QMW64019.1 twin-arginine translocase TatA/TatE family subunit [Devosia sp. MC521]